MQNNFFFFTLTTKINYIFLYNIIYVICIFITKLRVRVYFWNILVKAQLKKGLLNNDNFPKFNWNKDKLDFVSESNSSA